MSHVECKRHAEESKHEIRPSVSFITHSIFFSSGMVEEYHDLLAFILFITHNTFLVHFISHRCLERAVWRPYSLDSPLLGHRPQRGDVFKGVARMQGIYLIPYKCIRPSFQASVSRPGLPGQGFQVTASNPETKWTDQLTGRSDEWTN